MPSFSCPHPSTRLQIDNNLELLSEQRHITNQSLSRKDVLVDGKTSLLVVDNIFVLIYWYPIVFSTLLINRVFNYRK